ncbi:MAG: transcription termination/antitermination NusG family protein [Clostridia bacterium]|nr:transcription termination/antitermination NusG family protein [Clostridia bacterium]
MNQEARWFVVNTFAGYENKVKEDLEKSIDNLGLQETVLEVKYPTEEAIEVTPAGKKKTVQRKIFPGYVFIKVLVDVVETPRQDGGTSKDWVMNPHTWYVIRNTRGVSGFVGPGGKPVPLSDEDVTMMGVEHIPIELDIEVGESVRVVAGPLENFIGKVEKLDPERQKVKLSVSMFGRETPVELDYIQVEKL